MEVDEAMHTNHNPLPLKQNLSKLNTLFSAAGNLDVVKKTYWTYSSIIVRAMHVAFFYILTWTLGKC